MFRTMLRSQIAFDVVAAVLGALFSVVITGSGALVAAGFGVAVALRRLAPGLALGIAWVTAIVQMASGQYVMLADLLIPAVVYTASAYGGDLVRRAGLASSVVGALVGAVYITVQDTLRRSDGAALPALSVMNLSADVTKLAGLVVVILALLLLPWLAGLVARTRAAVRMSREAQLLAERDAARSERAVAVEQERVRIAREMHDIVAHSLAVVIAQADGARYALRASPQSADDALTTIGTTARRALADVRELLGTLRHEQGTAPTPDVDDIEQLVIDMRELGLDVRLERSGAACALPTTLQLAVYRIVQEALTNAFKHGASGEPVRVSLRYESEAVEIRVGNRPARDGRSGPGTGHGLIGMRERAALSGGAMTAGLRGDAFTVHVRIPVPSDAVRAPSTAPTRLNPSTDQEHPPR